MKQVTDSGQWLSKIVKTDSILLSIRDAARASNVTDTQVRYWIKNGYLNTVRSNTGVVKLPFTQVANIRLIKLFLDDGYTLAAAAQKMMQYKNVARSLIHLITDSIQKVSQEDGKTVFDLGLVANDPAKHIYGIEAPERVELIVQKNKGL